MPPKNKIQSKLNDVGQKNLFSFFKKSPVLDNQNTSLNDSSNPAKIEERKPAQIPSPQEQISSNAVPVLELPSSEMKPDLLKLESINCSTDVKTKRSRVIVDDDDDDIDEETQSLLISKILDSSKRSKINIASQVSEGNMEEDWNPSDTDDDINIHANVDDGDEDFIVSDNHDDDASIEDNSFANSSDSEMESPRKKSRNYTRTGGVPKKKCSSLKPPILPHKQNGAARQRDTKAQFDLVLPQVTPSNKPSLSTPSNSQMKTNRSNFDSSQTPNLFNSIPSTISITPILTPQTSISSLPLVLPEGVMGYGSHEHNNLDFLKPNYMKDKAGRRKDHPEYNPRSLFLSDKFMKDQTPAMHQWWQFKSNNMDTVLFFKVGKFYELFHMDADIGMKELDLIYMKGSKAHSGFPEVSYGKFASALVSKGYRVARVEQTETPEMLRERNESSKGKKEKVVVRELCSVMSKGTRTYCHLDDLSLLENNAHIPQSESLLLCITEKLSLSSGNYCAEGEGNGEGVLMFEYGLCAVDTILGTITVAQFQDNEQRARLRTFITKFGASEVLLQHNEYSPETLGIVKLMCPKAVVDSLRGDEMPAADEALNLLAAGQYFPLDKQGEFIAWPCILGMIIEGLQDGSSNLLMSAFGGTVWYLKRALIDFEILSLGKIFAYVPPEEEQELLDNGNTMDESSISSQELTEHAAPAFSNANLIAARQVTHLHDSDAVQKPKSMTLDAIALANLEILTNNYDRTDKGSLWAFLNRCRTSFGRRLLKEWVCNPLFNLTDIEQRRIAVNELLTLLGPQSERCRALLKEVPDLERLLTRVHTNGLRSKGADHPDSRAVMYESAIYNSRKIKDFADTLAGFDSLVKIGAIFDDIKISSPVLQKILKDPFATGSQRGKFPVGEMSKLLKFYRGIFDEKQAKKEGIIHPKAGVDPDYDQAKLDIANNASYFEEYLREMKRKVGISDLKYFGTNKDRYQIEVPMSSCNRVPNDWVSKSQKKTHRRYWTSAIESKVAELIAAEERLAEAQRDTLRRIFERFDGNREMWSNAVTCAAVLDALLSLAEVSSSPNYCWSTFVNRESSSDVSALRIHNGRHPMVEYMLSQRGDGDYIPNTIVLGGKNTFQNQVEYLPNLLLLTGPNMGGKSTLLRQACLIVIMAQIGCKVPADSCVLTPVDRIFTRVGASDKILAGQSTFFVELAETAVILRHATQDSLCILDELGRGTATFDGTAIAHAVVDHLVKHNRCRSLFATHYHSLIQDWEMDPRIKLGHMDCMVQGQGQDEVVTPGNEEVTFLYKLCDGSSPRSYGINVARLARLPSAVTDLAMKQSQEFEERLKSCSGGRHGSQGAITTSRDVMTSFFERLVSIANSDMGIDELTYVVAEIWQRWKHLSANN